ncbi:nucleoside diphosphate kinase B-like [Chiloscyllium punctatum]|uniref:nucleoside diphosphate kinase B-like n=1 Tax=Chiloscyllium punctatum TaxID=137246 RepID=UPI003B635CAE
MEKTMVAVKSDGIQRGLIGEIIHRLEKKGFKLIAMKMVKPTEEMAKQHYIDLKDKPFYSGLCKFTAAGPFVAMCWEGQSIVKVVRDMMGETNPVDSKPGTIRGDLCVQVGRNIIHGSDSLETAKKEVALWFKPEELIEWKSCMEGYLYE